jgi:hypothetical protein
VSGIDNTLLTQRSEFMRPDSLLAIVALTDENDCSIKEYSSYPLFAAPELHLPHARQDCTTKGPADPCCASCGQATPAGCAPDPQCTSNPSYTSADENTAIRGFGLVSHKERYGIEFFYQPSRYVGALTSGTVLNGMGQTVPNPIFAGGRATSDVFYAAIVGVPWQLIARQKNGAPDLVNGVSAVDATQIGGFKTAKELDLTDPKGNTFWADIAGDPENYVPAKSPFMVESTSPRMGVDPITNIATMPPGSTAPNAINGTEYTIGTPPSDIEYACIFALPQPIDCSQTTAGCDCSFNTTDKPICAPNPGNGNLPTLQVAAKAYPGTKHLAIAKGLADQGVVASICPKQLTDATQLDFGYRPAAKTIIDRLKVRIRGQ